MRINLLVLFLIFAPCFNFAMHADVVTGGLVAHWEGEGNADDSSGNDFDGTPFGGVAYSQGIFGMAFDFDGLNDSISTTLTFPASQSFTVSTWVNWRGHTSAAFQEIVSWWNTSTPLANRTFFGVAQGGQGPMRFGDAWTDVSIDLQTNQWVHLAATYDGTNNNRRVYVDGVLDDEQLAGPSAVFGTTLAIGRQGNLSGEFWNGLVDDLAIYDRVLTNAEIQFNANSVPEPSAMIFFSGFCGLFATRRRRS